MVPEDLIQFVSNHSGVFGCVPRGNSAGSRFVDFSHRIEAPETVADIPDTGMLREYFSVFGNLWLYHHEESGEAAFFIATPKHWVELRRYLLDWVEILDEDERDEIVPDWIDGCITIGEVPSSGNYLLVPTTGKDSGRVFKFDHDGFEFIEMGSDIIDFVKNALSPDSRALSEMASHMIFVDDKSDTQWWIEEMEDNAGNMIRTDP